MEEVPTFFQGKSAAPHCGQTWCCWKGRNASTMGRYVKYADLVAECREGGWSVRLYPVEVGGRSFAGDSDTPLFKDLKPDCTRQLGRYQRKQAFNSG